jgi:hypothetical protein
MVAECQRNSYDFFLNKDTGKTTICGPYRTSICRVYDIQIVNYVKFNYNEEEEQFEVSVYELVNSEMPEKKHVNAAGMIIFYAIPFFPVFYVIFMTISNFIPRQPIDNLIVQSLINQQ